MGASTQRRQFGEIVNFLVYCGFGWFFVQNVFTDWPPVLGSLVLAMLYMGHLAYKMYRAQKAQKEAHNWRKRLFPILDELKKVIETTKMVLEAKLLPEENILQVALLGAQEIVTNVENFLKQTDDTIWTDEQESFSLSSTYITFQSTLYAVQSELEKSVQNIMSAEMIRSLGGLAKAAIYFQKHKGPKVKEQFNEAAEILKEAVITKDIKKQLELLGLCNQKVLAMCS